MFEFEVGWIKKIGDGELCSVDIIVELDDYKEL